MRVTIQTLKNQKYTLDIDGESTVQALKERIHSELQLGEPDEQKCIYVGKILDNAQTLNSYKIAEDRPIICMITKKKAKAEAAPAAAAAPSPAPAAAPAAAAAAPVVSQAPAVMSAGHSPSPAPAANPVVAPVPAPASVPSSPPPASSPSPPPAASAAASNIVIGSAQEEVILNLMAMGDFSREQVQMALRAAFNNPDRAAEYLFTGIPPAIMAQMQASQAQARAAQAAAQAQPAEAAAPAAAPAPAAAASPAAGAGAGAAAGGMNPAALAGMLNMLGGAGGAGGAAGGAGAPNLAALQGLLGLLGAGAGAGAGAADAGAGGDDSPFNSAQFEQFRALLQSNPQLIPVMLQQLAQTHPELVALIQQNPQLLMALLGGMGAGAGQAGGAGAVPPGARRIQVTQEEIAQLEQLEALGFSRQRALEAWLACDRNFELAANYLLENGNEDFDDAPAGGAGGQ